MDYFTTHGWIDQERIEQQDRAAADWRLDGISDAAAGRSPESNNPAYLDGYFGHLRESVERGQTLIVGFPPEATDAAAGKEF
jgi:hypothetical protein